MGKVWTMLSDFMAVIMITGLDSLNSPVRPLEALIHPCVCIVIGLDSELYEEKFLTSVKLGTAGHRRQDCHRPVYIRTLVVICFCLAPAPAHALRFLYHKNASIARTLLTFSHNSEFSLVA